MTRVEDSNGQEIGGKLHFAVANSEEIEEIFVSAEELEADVLEIPFVNVILRVYFVAPPKASPEVPAAEAADEVPSTEEVAGDPTLKRARIDPESQVGG